ncbi:MAG: exopolyphosphatase [Syntrophobacteria bacterium]
MERLASIDLGSNTLRLLIADHLASGVLRPITKERRITRLGENFLPSRRLQPQAMARSIAALKEFGDLMTQRGVSSYLAGATAVVREAGNGEEFLSMVRRETSLQVRLLSGSEEARLSLLGVASAIRATDAPMAVFDIGGGSSELIWTPEAARGPAECASLPVGVVHLTETFLKEDPPGREACARLGRQVHTMLDTVAFGDKLQRSMWVGTAGTVTTLAAMRLELRRYDPERINGTVLEKPWLADLCQRLAVMPVARRRQLPGLERGREDIILAGAVVTLELMNTFRFTRCTASDGGLLEGLFLEVCGSLAPSLENSKGSINKRTLL